MKRNKEKLYRFALYGRSGSGKTCFLATMAMGAVGHERGLTCERMPVTVPEPQEGLDAGKNSADDERIGLHAGKEWIDKALRALESGNRPDANPATFDGVPASVDYQIGTPLRGDFFVRTVDYSGELIHPGEEYQEQSHVNDLKNCLAECDGFLLLAETPRSPDDHKVLSDELRLLRESFASLQESNDSTHTPVAVVITKWDRWSEVNFSSPKGEIDKLREYLAENQPHNSLVETIRNAQVHHDYGDDTEALGLFDGNCAVFPATAFGQSVQRDGFDSPVVGQQRPSGLLDPFVWLAERRDDLDANQIKNRWSEHHRHCWLPWRCLKTRGIAVEAKRLLKKMPEKSPNTSLVRGILRSASLSFAATLVAWIAVALLALGGVYGGLRSHEFRKAVASLEDSKTTEPELRELQSWFDSYSRAWNGIFFSPGADDALNRVSEIDGVIENRYWTQVEGAGDPVTKANAAETYIKNCKNGVHVTECTTIIAEHKASLARQENADWFSVHQKQSEGAKDEESLQKLQENLRKDFPEPGFATGDQRKALRQLRNNTATQLANIRSEKDWQQFVAAYGDAINADDSVAASRLLAARQPRDNQWMELVKRFPQDVQKITTKGYKALLKDRRYDDASHHIDECRQSLKDLETTLRPHAPAVAEFLLKGHRDLQEYSEDVEKQHDGYLYEQVRSRRDKDSCRHYLDRAPLREMRSEVAAYLDHLEKMAKPITAKVEVKIKWDAAYDWGNQNTVRVFLDDVAVLKTGEEPATAGELSGVMGSFSIASKKLQDSSKIRVTIVERDNWPKKNDDSGQGVATVTIRELIEGRFIPLSTNEGGGMKNQARLQFAPGELPEQPELSPWKEQ